MTYSTGSSVAAAAFTSLSADSGASISFDTIAATLGKAASEADQTFNDALIAFNGSKQTTADAVAFQQSSQAWKFSQDAVAKVSENFGDVMKSIIQKA